jgi:hypothetical protein
VNYQMTGIRLSAVGPDPARFDPLELSFVNPDGTGPEDVVLYLPNTGGKTVLLRLLFGVLQPQAAERVGSEESARRTLGMTGYVGERDTSHVAIEWRIAAGGRFVDDSVLVTGQVAEWRGGRPSGNPSDLVRLWYSIKGPAGAVGLDHLPIETQGSEGVRRRERLRAFREWLNELAKTERRGGPSVTVVETQRDWLVHLESLGLDPAIFEYQARMNHDEAGASALARFRDDRDFIAFFLEAVMDPAELAPLDRQFDEAGEKVRMYPEFEHRLRFAQAVLGPLEPMDYEVAAARAARVAAEAAREAALALLGRLVTGATTAAARERTVRATEREQDAEAKRLDSLRNRLFDEHREYRRLAAEFASRDAGVAHKAAKTRLTTLELDERAWRTVGDVAELRGAEAEVLALHEAYAAELERLRPQRDERDEAARDLVRRLAADAVRSTDRASRERARAQDAKERAGKAAKDRTDALIEAGRLDALREEGERRLEAVRARRARLVVGGLLVETERSDEARDREQARSTAAAARVEAIGIETGTLATAQTKLDWTESAAGPLITSAALEHGRANEAVAAIEAERAAIIGQPLLSELAESGAFDLEIIGPALVERLIGRAAAADDARVALEVRGTDDRRALRGLEADGLLPPPPDVERAVSRLVAAGIAGALPGVRYIAESVAAARREAVIARRPALAGGVVLVDAGELEHARSVIEGAGLDPAMIIAVGTAVELVAAEGEDDEPADRFIVPPARAVWDPAAGPEERERREARVGSLDAERTVLQERADTARSTAERLVRHLAVAPPGWLAAKRAERDALRSTLDALVEARRERQAERKQIGEKLDQLREESGRSATAALEATKRAGELGRLAEDEAAVADVTSTIERLVTEAHEWREAATRSATEEARWRTEAEEAGTAAIELLGVEARLREAIAAVTLRDIVPDPSLAEAEAVVADLSDLERLRHRFEALDEKLRGALSGSEVAARREAAIRARNAVAAKLEALAADVRARAEALAQRPEAADLVGRREATVRAETEANGGRYAERAAFAASERARSELAAVEDEVRAARRPVKLPDERRPPDHLAAARMAAETRQLAEETAAKFGEIERAAQASKDQADEAGRLAGGLGTLGTTLRMALRLGADDPVAVAAPYEGGLESAGASALAAGNRLAEAEAAGTAADALWRARIEELRAVLAADEFATLAASDRLHRRLASSAPEVLARDVTELVADIKTTVGMLRSEIAELGENIKLVVASVAKTVNKAISYLHLAESRSRMPASLAGWGGEPFLQVRFERPPAEELDKRLTVFVHEVVSRPAGARPAGTKLLLQALERAVAGGFKVRILKPNEGFELIRIPVTELSSITVSNGQRATATIALMLMLAELRRQSRSAARPASVGTLLLDNPFGNANAGFLIDVQRTVAAASGIQLVYTTGIADFAALRRFKTIPLSNDAARRSMRKYVRADEELLRLLVPADEGPGGRVSAVEVAASRDDH